MQCLQLLTLFVAVGLCTCASGISDAVYSRKGVGNDDKVILRIMHTSDMRGSFAETSQDGRSSCSAKDSEEGRCYGGFARIASVLRKERNSNTVLFLNSGNNYMGNNDELYAHHREKIVTKFLELIFVNSITFGAHDFDQGVDGIVKALDSMQYFAPVVCNLDNSKVPELRNSRKLRNSTYFLSDMDKLRKIGIIGYANPRAAELSNPGQIKFLDVISSVREEAKRLKAEEGISIIIVTGNSGFEMDKKIAEEVEDVDLVLGGNADKFFYNGPKPDTEEPEGPYPYVVQQANGKKVYVAQSYAYTKYVGNLTVEFDVEGNITKLDGNLILLDKNVPKAEDVEEELEKWRQLLPKKP